MSEAHTPVAEIVPCGRRHAHCAAWNKRCPFQWKIEVVVCADRKLSKETLAALGDMGRAACKAIEVAG